MSKYQEALIRIGTIFVPFACNDDGDKDYCHLRDNEDYEETYTTLQEAVTKAEKYDEMMKPKRVIGISSTSDGIVGNCPNKECSKLVVHPRGHIYYALGVGKRCPNCGQALDWEDEKK